MKYTQLVRKRNSPVFFLTSRAILKPSSMNSTTWTKSVSLNCLEVSAGAPGSQEQGCQTVITRVSEIRCFIYI